MDHLRSGVQDQPGQHGETPSLLKRKNNNNKEMVIVAWLRQENRLNPEGGGCSEPRPRHCTPAWTTEGDSVSEEREMAIEVLLYKSRNRYRADG